MHKAGHKTDVQSQLLTKRQKLLNLNSKAVLGVALLSFAVPGLASAQSSDVSNRLQRIEREIDTLSRAVYRGEEPPEGHQFSAGLNDQYQATLEVRLNAIEEQLRSLTGQIEENRYKVEQIEKRLNMSLSDIEMRLNDQAPAAADGSQVITDMPSPSIEINQPNEVPDSLQTPAEQIAENPDAAYSPDQPASTLPADAATLYEDAFTELKAGKNVEAQTKFEQFLNIYQDDKLANNARYWLAETYYVQNNYDAAAKAFATAYQKDPKGTKAADNLLKLGLSLNALGRDKDACVALKQLDKEFGITNSAVVQRGEKEREKLSCS